MLLLFARVHDASRRVGGHRLNTSVEIEEQNTNINVYSIISRYIVSYFVVIGTPPSNLSFCFRLPVIDRSKR